MVLSSSTRSRDRRHVLPHPVIGAIGALTLAVVACSDVTAPLPREGAPEKLSFSTGSAFTGNTSWTVRGDTVVFQRDEWGGDGPQRYVVHVVPTAEAWRNFWSAAENAGVNKWRGSYVNESIADGEGWQLVLETRTSRIESGGYSAYPDNAGRKKNSRERTEAFTAFLAALYVLVGEPCECL